MVSRVLVLCLFMILNSYLFYVAWWGESGYLAHTALVNQYEEAKERCREVDSQNRQLSREIRLLQSDTPYIEKMVRERLHYLHDNEILYLFGEEDAPAESKKPTGSKSYER